MCDCLKINDTELLEAGEVLPCPFCGNGTRIKSESAAGGSRPLIWVVCADDDCGASIGLGEWSNAAAVAKWNRAGAKIAELEEKLRELPFVVAALDAALVERDYYRTKLNEIN